MTDPEQGWRWWVYIAGRCLANLPRAVRHPLPVVDALINLEREVVWPPEIHGLRPSGSLTLSERTFLYWLCRTHMPALAFEFGTGRGYTTSLLAKQCGRVWTLDRARLPGYTYSDNVVLLTGDSRSFDFQEFRGQMDLVFVDGGHDKETIRSDSESAFSMRSPHGVVIWHDCDVQHRDVWRYILELRRRHQHRWLLRVADTRFVVLVPTKVLEGSGP